MTRSTIKKHERGMTMVEVAVTLVIAGVLLAGALTALEAYWQTQLRQKQEDRFTRVQQAIGIFVYNNKRYPRVAYNNLTAEDMAYGAEADIADLNGVNAPGNCTTNGSKMGACRQRGMRGGQSNQAIKVWRGMLPFKALGLSEEYAYDVYGSRLVYVVTDVMTKAYDGTANTFSLQNGAIRVQKFFPNLKPNPGKIDVVTPPGSGHFFLFSPGKNRAGGITQEGRVAVPCTTLNSRAGEERTQCLLRKDAIYYAHEFDLANLNVRTAGTNSPLFDDKTMFFAPSDPNAWSSGQNVSVEAENLGLGSNNPAYKLDVAGDARVGHDLLIGGNITDGTIDIQPDAIKIGADCSADFMVGGVNWHDGGDVCDAPAPVQEFDCGSYDDDGTTRYKVLKGFNNGLPICVAVDGSCQGKVDVLCPGSANPVVVEVYPDPDDHNKMFSDTQRFPLDGTYIDAGKDAQFQYVCTSGVLGLDPREGSCN